MTLRPTTTEPAVHHYPARTSDGSAGQPGSEGRLGKPAGYKAHGACKAPEARSNLFDRREAALPMMENRQ